MSGFGKKVASMNCPVCTVPLSMSDRQGIEIDYCPQCRGVWLDRGELDKLIERGIEAKPTPTASTPHLQVVPSAMVPSYHGGGHHHHYHRRKSWLAELFD